MNKLPAKFTVKSDDTITTFTEVDDGVYYGETTHEDRTVTGGEIDEAVIQYFLATGFYTIIEEKKELKLKSFKFYHEQFPDVVETAVAHEDIDMYSVRFTDRGNGPVSTAWYTPEAVDGYIEQAIWVMVSIPEKFLFHTDLYRDIKFIAAMNEDGRWGTFSQDGYPLTDYRYTEAEINNYIEDGAWIIDEELAEVPEPEGVNQGCYFNGMSAEDFPNNLCAEILEELENESDAYTLRQIQKFTSRYDFTVTCIGEEFIVTSGDGKNEYHVADANKLLDVLEAIALLEDALE